MKFHRANALFSEQQYLHNQASFWPMPTAWGSTSTDAPLRIYWQRGGSGLVSVLPVLGHYAPLRVANRVRLPIEKAAELAGVDPKTVSLVRPLLNQYGLASSKLVTYHGNSLTQWTVLPSIAASTNGTGTHINYFTFHSRFIYGGNWAQLTSVQRLLYLAVATQASTSNLPVNSNPILCGGLLNGTEIGDIEAAQQACSQRWVRLARVSFSSLAKITGASVSALHTAVDALKRPEVWPGAGGDAVFLRHAPLAPYPSDGGALIYHFRDHAPHWPWDDLNGSAGA